MSKPKSTDKKYDVYRKDFHVKPGSSDGGERWEPRQVVSAIAHRVRGRSDAWIAEEVGREVDSVHRFLWGIFDNPGYDENGKRSSVLKNLLKDKLPPSPLDPDRILTEAESNLLIKMIDRKKKGRQSMVLWKRGHTKRTLRLIFNLTNERLRELEMLKDGRFRSMFDTLPD
jgi:hypothetical protein